jgi:hypothetical protein
MRLRDLNPFYVLGLILALSPLSLIVAFSGYVISARIYLGYWPHYNHPDPKQLGWWGWHGLLQLGFIGFPLSSLVTITCALILRAKIRTAQFWAIILASIVSVITVMIYARLDPGGFVNWFFD